MNKSLMGILVFFALGASFVTSFSQEIPDAVYDVFESHCAISGCHSGIDARAGLDLSEDFIPASLINVASEGKPGMLRVKPADPVNSYLIMKVKGGQGIAGERMPKRGTPLTPAEISTLETWIESMPRSQGRVAPPFKQAFPGLSLSTVPTTQTMAKGSFSYRIAHRWRGPVDDGFAKLFGLDAGAHMFTQLAFAITNDFQFSVARSGENATFELAGKWRFLRETTDGSVPLSAAIRAGLDWETIKEITDPDKSGSGGFLSRSDSERFHWFAQVAVSKQLHERFSILVVPGILLNGNVNSADEDAILTLSYAAKFNLQKNFSIFVEGVPIVSGSGEADVVGGPRTESGEQLFNDTFTIGLEKRVGGHVFHVYITNSLGLATNQYMSGGNFDFSDGDFRLGFNIYRTLSLP